MKCRRDKYRCHCFSLCLGPPLCDATHPLNPLTLPDIREVKIQLNKRFEGKFDHSVCEVLHEPTNPLSQGGVLPPSKPQGEPRPNDSVFSSRGTRCSKSKGIPWGNREKGVIK